MADDMKRSDGFLEDLEAGQALTKKKRLVLALFDDEAAAETAVSALKEWDKLDDDVKLHNISILALDSEGKLTDASLARVRATGAAAGFAGWLLVVILAGPIGPVLAMPVIGGIFGAVYHPGFGLDKHQRERIAAELKSGKVAVGVFVKHDEEAAAVSAKLEQLRGASEVHDVGDAVDAVARAAEESTEG